MDSETRERFGQLEKKISNNHVAVVAKLDQLLAQKSEYAILMNKIESIEKRLTALENK